MNLKDLLSGIAVVIDDKIGNANAVANGDVGNHVPIVDPINEIVDRIEQEWNLPLYKTDRMPPQAIWPNLLRSASFILLDWKLWPSGGSHLEREGINENVRFLEQAKDYFVPVFIFTNENPEDVKDKLPNTVYRSESPEKSFIFIQAKGELLSDDSLDLSVERWMRGNASVYVLKTWDRVFRDAKKDLFGSMYAKNPDWPRVFWNAYKRDSVDPSSSLMHLINDSLRGRMRTTAFETGILTDSRSETSRVPMNDLRALIHETIFQKSTEPEDQIRCGDLFGLPKGKYLLNVRPDCDCIPRDGSGYDAVDLYCIEGKKMSESDLRKKYHNGHFSERVDESVVFAAFERKSIRFKFNTLRIEKFGQLKDQRIGRLLHPYLTRIQQRYALFLQRQGLPRIPEEAIPFEPDNQEK